MDGSDDLVPPYIAILSEAAALVFELTVEESDQERATIIILKSLFQRFAGTPA